MLSAIISLVLAVVSVILVVKLLLLAPTILLYALVTAGLAIKFVAKKILGAIPWIVSALVATTVGFIGLGRQFFGAGSAKSFVEQFLPPRDFERETLSLTLIELMIIVREKILRQVTCLRLNG